jgi:cobalamin biosynthesis protein CobT
MTSNIKAKNPAKEAPTEPFKRAVGICLRAIAGRSDIEVGFAAERPGLAANKARLPEPARRLTERAATPIRSRCGSPVTIRRCIASSCRAASRRAPCSMRSSRRASRRSARAAWAV